MREVALLDSPSPQIEWLASHFDSPESVSEFLNSHWRIVPDPETVEYIRTPRRQLRDAIKLGVFEGDCDDASTLAASILAARGIPSELVAIRLPGDKEFSHVFLRSFGLPIDPITGGLLIQDHAEEMILPI